MLRRATRRAQLRPAAGLDRGEVLPKPLVSVSAVVAFWPRASTRGGGMACESGRRANGRPWPGPTWPNSGWCGVSRAAGLAVWSGRERTYCRERVASVVSARCPRCFSGLRSAGSGGEGARVAWCGRGRGAGRTPFLIGNAPPRRRDRAGLVMLAHVGGRHAQGWPRRQFAALLSQLGLCVLCPPLSSWPIYVPAARALLWGYNLSPESVSSTGNPLRKADHIPPRYQPTAYYRIQPTASRTSSLLPFRRLVALASGRRLLRYIPAAPLVWPNSIAAPALTGPRDRARGGVGRPRVGVAVHASELLIPHEKQP